ncbi:hypothetical protein VP01_3168g1 [Puccinia sorghi]|uniref:Uncharacterized protein n=1 Tax=Puccinia sorghi TaxID=27349 RepID=A0A0L6UZK2_9BASI|nr:hypothetical protein VP01_3168g1 [Puccinia sorghi]
MKLHASAMETALVNAKKKGKKKKSFFYESTFSFSFRIFSSFLILLYIFFCLINSEESHSRSIRFLLFIHSCFLLLFMFLILNSISNLLFSHHFRNISLKIIKIFCLVAFNLLPLYSHLVACVISSFSLKLVKLWRVLVRSECFEVPVPISLGSFSIYNNHRKEDRGLNCESHLDYWEISCGSGLKPTHFQPLIYKQLNTTANNLMFFTWYFQRKMNEYREVLFTAEMIRTETISTFFFSIIFEPEKKCFIRSEHLIPFHLFWSVNMYIISVLSDETIAYAMGYFQICTEGGGDKKQKKEANFGSLSSQTGRPEIATSFWKIWDPLNLVHIGLTQNNLSNSKILVKLLTLIGSSMSHVVHLIQDVVPCSSQGRNYECHYQHRATVLFLLKTASIVALVGEFCQCTVSGFLKPLPGCSATARYCYPTLLSSLQFFLLAVRKSMLVMRRLKIIPPVGETPGKS